MLTVHVHLQEFMDSMPFADCLVTLQAHVVAGWLVPVEDARSRPGSTSALRRSSPVVLEFDDDLAVDLQAQARTNALGEVTLELNLRDAFREVRSQRHGDKPPTTVQGQLSASADVHGLVLPARYRFEKLTKPDAELNLVLVADAARSIVGDTSATHTTLWFQLHAAPRQGDRLVCVLRPAPPGVERAVGLNFDAQRAHTAVTVFSGLTPERAHEYELRLVQPDGAWYRLTRGSVRTLAANPQRLTVAFASCHLPDRQAALGRWQALAERDDIDLAFLIGDQIYADGIEKLFGNASWNKRFERRYNQLWTYQPMRRVLRSLPTYMALDDHEVADDWGTEEIDAEREAAGANAYRVFQHAHNPIGFGATFLDYSFRRGPAAFYVTDSRTARGGE